MAGFEGYLPKWAIGLSNGELQLGVQLCTKDGRRVGNGFVVDIWDIERFQLYIVMTDAGNTMLLTVEEINEYYHIGLYICSQERIYKDFSRGDKIE